MLSSAGFHPLEFAPSIHPAFTAADYLPALVVAVVVLLFACALVVVSVRRRDAE